MYKAILFDFFDVIHRDHQKAWLAQNGFTREGAFAEASDLLDEGLINFEEYLQRYAKASGKLAGHIREQFAELAAIDEKVVALIRHLGDHYRTGLVSNSHSDELRPILERHGLAELFHEIIISSEVAVAKPSEEIFHLALKRLGVEPHEAVFIDDNPVNVAAARQVGISGVVFSGIDDLVKELRALELKLPKTLQTN